MYKEAEVFGAITLNEDLDAYDYLVRRKIDSNLVFEPANHESSFYDLPDGVIQGDYSKMLTHGLVASCFPELPNGDIGEEADRLIDIFYATKDGLIKVVDQPESESTDAEIEAIHDWDIEDVASLADEAYKAFVNEAQDSSDLMPDQAWLNDASALYWLRVRSVGLAAMSKADEYEDPVI